MNLLPGVRELRTPLASGYLWLIWLWLLLGGLGWLPTERPPGDGEIARLWGLGDALGATVVLAAVSFIAYLVGSFLEMDPDGRIARLLAPRVIIARAKPRYFGILRASAVEVGSRFGLNEEDIQEVQEMTQSVDRSLSADAVSDLMQLLQQRKELPAINDVEGYNIGYALTKISEPPTVVRVASLAKYLETHPPRGTMLGFIEIGYAEGVQRNLDSYSTIAQIIREMPQLASRLLVKNKDLYGKYDRLMAEASLRMNVSIPLTVLLIAAIWMSDFFIWLQTTLTLPTLVFGSLLLRQGLLRMVSARDVIAQALTIDEVQSRHVPTDEVTDNQVNEDSGASAQESDRSSEL